MKQFITFLFAFVITINLFAQTSKKNDNISQLLRESISEVDKSFGQQIDEYTILTSAGYDENDGVKQFTYYYVVSAEIWEDLLVAVDEMKQLNFDGFKTMCQTNKDVSLFMKTLSDNGIELVLSYLCKNEYVSIVYSVEEIKQFNK